ncbi:MAG: transglycosylase domain-containing protein [Anaerolineales bacterium]|nr:transglycosylase domain-containing protein [Anaerolineales bacterium]
MTEEQKTNPNQDNPQPEDTQSDENSRQRFRRLTGELNPDDLKALPPDLVFPVDENGNLFELSDELRGSTQENYQKNLDSGQGPDGSFSLELGSVSPEDRYHSILNNSQEEKPEKDNSGQEISLADQEISESSQTPVNRKQFIPPPPLGHTPERGIPLVDEDDMPLPPRSNHPGGVGRDSERIIRSDSAPTNYPPLRRPISQPVSSSPNPAGRKKQDTAKPRASVSVPASQIKQQPKKKGMPKKERHLGCWTRSFFYLLIIGVVIGIAGITAGVIFYFDVASELPDVDDLYSHTSQFETTRILDRHGNLLYEIIDPNAGRRTWVPLEEISPYLIAATIATEDENYYSHPGFSISAILRAFWQNLSSGETVSGASTITQQVARTLLFTPEEANRVSYWRKMREAMLAQEITRRYSKDDILEIYLNENNYGNHSYGIQAAAESYFSIPASKLTLTQASFLAGIPQSPAVYDVFTNRDAVFNRQEDVLRLMVEMSSDQNCIYTSVNAAPICVSFDAASEAAYALRDYEFTETVVEMKYPHWVNYIRTQLEAMYEPGTIYHSGFNVYTTLEPALQDLAQEIVAKQVAALEENNAQSGALVAIQPSTGEILAMVGSVDFYNEDISGQVNMAVSPRQPGSSIKPFTYTAAFEKGWTPATLIWDVETDFPASEDPYDTNIYTPVNYDGKYHGPVLARDALANSYNVPAVKALEYVGIYDNPDTEEKEGLIAFSERLGIKTFTEDYYGYSLTLGGGEVTLLDMVGAYSVYANNGRLISPVAITKITDNQGEVFYEYKPPTGERVISAEHAYLISSILSDNNARTPAFGPNSVLNLSFPVAVKTGTTNDYRDNWTIGYTPDLTVGVWVGNPDYTPMIDTSGLSGAAPAWAEFMSLAVQSLTGGSTSYFVKPSGIEEHIICTISGTEPSDWCPSEKREIFAKDQPPLDNNKDLLQQVIIDTWTEKLASSACNNFSTKKKGINIEDPWGLKWLKETSDGKAWAEEFGLDDTNFVVPTEECTLDDPRPILEFTYPEQDRVVTENPVRIFVMADATENFEKFKLYWAPGDDPDEEDYELLYTKKIPVSDPQEIMDWDVTDIPNGDVTLKLYMESSEDTYAETFLHFQLNIPTPTPTRTPTPKPTKTPTPEPTITLTPPASNTPIPTSTLTQVPNSPTSTETVVPSQTPTPTENP